MQAPKRQVGTSAVAARPITRGPGHHWFGYYDKQQLDPSGRHALAMRAGFEGRQPRADDEIAIGMIDLADGERWIDLGSSRAWCWQQGCMLQWIPGSRSEVIWNDREGERFVARILDVVSGARRTLPLPIYTLSPDGRTALTLDFARLDVMRPGYGYAGVADPFHDQAAPEGSGIWSMDLATGSIRLVMSLAQLARIPWLEPELDGRKSWFNVPIFNPSGKRFLVLNRCQRNDRDWLATRMLTAAVDGSDVRIVDPHGHTSHLVWRDDATIIAWTRVPGRTEGFFLLDERTGAFEPIGQEAMPLNGHITCVPDTDNEWILNDTYPQGPERLQQLYLYHVPTRRRVELGPFRSPAGYDGDWRCDLHPRTSRDGRRVYIDSAHGGGRQIYEIDIGAVIGAV